MKVRILSGNQTGAVVEMPQTEAENALATGFAEVYVGEVQVPPRLAHKLSDSTVPEASDLIVKARTPEQLDVIEKAELEGKNRKGVLDEIAARRNEFARESLVHGNVEEVGARVALVDAAGLVAIEAAEKAGQDRKGVHEAIAKRRAELKEA